MDILLQLNGNGGDLVMKKNQQGQYTDFIQIFGFENVPLLALFGGNKEESTPILRNPNEQRFDYWGNSLMLDTPEAQFNSETQRVLYSTPLTSNGRVIIENAIKNDLEFMKMFANVTVRTEIIATDVLKINIVLIRPDNLEKNEFVFLWDKTKEELTQQDATDTFVQTNFGLQYQLQFNL